MSETLKADLDRLGFGKLELTPLAGQEEDTIWKAPVPGKSAEIIWRMLKAGLTSHWPVTVGHDESVSRVAETLDINGGETDLPAILKAAETLTASEFLQRKKMLDEEFYADRLAESPQPWPAEPPNKAGL